MATISSTANTIGYRADDHGDSMETATVLELFRNVYAVAGVISPLTDRDFFQFVTTGTTRLTVEVERHIADLDIELEVYSSNGTPIALEDPSGENALGASRILDLAAGTYYAEVRSDGGAGEAGQYNLIIRV
jgi:hypothetical protein